MSKENIGREPCTPNKTPEHPRDIADLAALVVGHLGPHESEEEEDGTLMIFVWRDCAMTIKFPSGRRMYARSQHGHTLDSMVDEFAVGVITEYCQSAGIAIAEIRVHKAPTEASSPEQIFAWFQSIPDISITVFPPEGIGFGGPVPSAGGAA